MIEMTTRVPAQMRGLSPISGNNALQINAAIDALAAANTTAVYGQITFGIQ